jgi:hypothetical protein
MHTYIADNAGVLTGPVELPVIPGIGIQVPGNAIQVAKKLANPVLGKVWALVDGQPQQLADHRGTVYSTATGAEQQHTELGELPSGLTTEPRPSADHSWTGNTWAFDAGLQASNRIALSAQLCQSVDTAADAARRAVAGDPLRAVEYANAATEAQAFAAASYQGTVPPMVAAWAINGRTPQQAADSILAEAAQYNAALVQLRTVRLNAKELIRAAMAAGNVEQAQDIAAETIASIEAAVAGIGNNA